MLVRLLSISFIGSILLTGCNKYKPDKLDGELAYLVGTWAWDSTYHSHNWCTGPTLEENIYPESYGNDFSLLFEEGGCISFYANDSLIKIQGVTLDFFQEEGSGDKHVVFILENGSRFSGVGSLNQTRFIPFPFTGEPSCESYLNYFSKQ